MLRTSVRSVIASLISVRSSALAVFRDGKIALHKSSKLDVKIKSARFLVPKELGLDGEPVVRAVAP